MLFLIVGTLICAQAELSDEQLSNIRSEAEQEALQLLGISDGRATGDLPDAVIERATTAIEMYLAKAAAIEAARTNASSFSPGRRLFSLFSDDELAELYDEDTIDDEIDSPGMGFSRKLQAYAGTSTPADPAESAAYCTLKSDTELVPDPVKVIQDAYIETTDPGVCCSACLFRKDCYGWTVKIASSDGRNGCFLRGKEFTEGTVVGFTSGIMDPNIEWRPPAKPSPKPLAAGKAKYAQVLKLSAKFYAAQRSGVIPSKYEIDWRKSSHTKDPARGGWYDAANTIKANYPMGAAVSYIAWAMVSFPAAFKSSGADTAYLQQLQVANDYLLQCYNEQKKEFIGQIGRPSFDQAFWGRPEEAPQSNRPAYVWKGTMRASDLLSNVAAGWASSSIGFRKSNPGYAFLLLDKAKSMYAWAKTREGRYSEAFKESVYTLYPSSDFLDNQAWAAAWLYKATKDARYLADAVKYWERSYGKDKFLADVYPGWDSMWAATAVLMRQISRSGVKITGGKLFNDYYDYNFYPSWVKANGKNDIVRTKGGLTYPAWNVWGNLQFATTTSMIMLQDTIGNKQSWQKKGELEYARRSVNYALGSTGRSYVVGWGQSPPKNWRHPGSSCADLPSKCDIQNYYMRANNPQTMVGALVGGPAGRRRNPNDQDEYIDNRSDFAVNEPSVIMNAGLVGALAGLLTYS